MSTTTPTSQQVSALQVLKDDHRDVEALFAQFESAGPKAKKKREAIVARIIEALSVHASIEETTFYPAVRERIADSESDVLEALEEHHVVKWTLSELEAMSANDERFVAKVTVLMEMIRHHVKEEEKEMFPKVRDALTRTELADLGDALKSARKMASKRPHPRDPDTPPGNIAAAAVNMPMDAARSAGQAAVRKVRELAGR
jgi:hemerythrin superfamily protein